MVLSQELMEKFLAKVLNLLATLYFNTSLLRQLFDVYETQHIKALTFPPLSLSCKRHQHRFMD